LALDALFTETTVSRCARGDQVQLNDKLLRGQARQRILDCMQLWRDKGLVKGYFRVESRNSFPTAAGLASSSSGYAALATALDRMTGQQTCMRGLTRLARQGSGSAARSIYGGLTALAATADPAAQWLAPADDVPWGMVIAVVKAPVKETGSRAGMEQSRLTSPYYEQWLATARSDYRKMRAALRKWDLAATGELLEANMLAMHACMLATRPPLVYWSSATLSIFHAVKQWRRRGLQAYATTDAGAHVALLCCRDDLVAVAKQVRALARHGVGVVDVIKANPGGSAEVISVA
jgi:diphosphomevalonate decarboxylase